MTVIYKDVIQISFGVGLFINAILFIPQVIKIWTSKNAKELSFITFIGFWLIQWATTMHGFIMHDYLLAYGTLLSIFTCGAVIFLMIYYHSKSKYITGKN